MTERAATMSTLVGIIAPFYWRIGPHGVLLNLLAHLERDRYEPIVAVPRNGPAKDDLQARGVAVELLPGARNLGRRVGVLRAGPQLLSTWSGARQVSSFVRRRGIRVVHTNNEACWAGMIGARRARVPSIVHVHGLGFATSRFGGRLLAMMINANSDRVIAVSHAVADALQEAGVERNKIRVIYNGIDTERFRPGIDVTKTRSEFRMASGALAIGMFGGLDPRKGHRLLIEAAAIVRNSIPDVRILIVGGQIPGGADASSAGYRRELGELAISTGLGDALTFTGERQDIPQLMSMMDVVVQPSETEAGPLVPLEAMSTGKPVVATNVGGNPEEIADGETGLLIPPRNARALADAILALLRDAGYRQRMGAAGRKRVERQFSARRMAEQIQDIYDELLRSEK